MLRTRRTSPSRKRSGGTAATRPLAALMAALASAAVPAWSASPTASPAVPPPAAPAPQGETDSPPSAEPPVAPQPLAELAPAAEIRRRLEALRAIDNPSQEDRTRIERLGQALDLIGRAESHRERAAEYRDLLAQLPSRLERVRSQQISMPSMPEPATAEQLDQALKMATAELAASREALAQLDGQIAQLAERRRQLPEEIARARSGASEARLEVEKLPPPAPGSPDSTRQLALARLDEQLSLIAALEADLDSLDARAEMYGAQRELAQRRIDAADAWMRQVRTALESLRHRAAQEAEELALAQGSSTGRDADPRAARTLSESAAVARRIREVGDLRDQIADEIDLRRQEIDRVNRDLATDRERSRVAGGFAQLSELLRRQRQALPDARGLASQASRIRQLRATIDLERIDRSMEIERISALERALASMPSDAEYAALVRSHRETLVRLQGMLDDLSTRLAKLAAADLEFATSVREYRSFIDQQVLWLRSGPAIWEVTPGSLRAALESITAAITDRAQWHAALVQARSEGEWALGGLGIAGLLLIVRPLLRRWLERLGAAVTRGRTDRFILTIEALAATVLMSVAAPVLMVGLGLALRPNDAGAPLIGALSSMLLQGALWVGLLLFTRRLVRRQGLAIDHFGWRLDQVELLYRVSLRLFRVTVPLVLLAIFCARLSEHGAERTIAGLVFIPCQLMLAWAGWRLFSPGRGLYAAHIAQHPTGWIARLTWVWLPLVVGVPLASAVLMLIGWGYTSALLIDRLVQSAVLALGAAVLEGVLLRGLEFAARAFAARSRAQVAAAPQGIAAAEEVQREAVRNEIAAGSRQARMTIRALTIGVLLGGLALVWSELLPALRVFDEILLWQGATDPVTVGDLTLALLIGGIAIFAARNLPGAIEVLLLQHAGMTPGGRYAATAVMRYAIVIVAVLIVGSRLGLAWSSVQWLVAAIGVGLGFGLQEIVGNFVAGLILLFEQPVRVGDIVTVGDRTGQVVKIRIRSTTIRDPDGKDLIIPNKHLITERVVNWTLSGAPLRLVLPVGVAYGTDLALAERLMRDAAASVDTILQTPPPNPQLMGFGPNSIDFEMRVFVARIDQLMPTRHALTRAIQAAFEDAGVTIAFPQLDVHVDTGAIERLMKEVQR